MANGITHLGPHASGVLIPATNKPTPLGGHASGVLPLATKKPTSATAAPASSLPHEATYNHSAGTALTRLHISRPSAEGTPSPRALEHYPTAAPDSNPCMNKVGKALEFKIEKRGKNSAISMNSMLSHLDTRRLAPGHPWAFKLNKNTADNSAWNSGNSGATYKPNAGNVEPAMQSIANHPVKPLPFNTDKSGKISANSAMATHQGSTPSTVSGPSNQLGPVFFHCLSVEPLPSTPPTFP
jgi:hypothetical protein